MNKQKTKLWRGLSVGAGLLFFLWFLLPLLRAGSLNIGAVTGLSLSALLALLGLFWPSVRQLLRCLWQLWAGKALLSLLLALALTVAALAAAGTACMISAACRAPSGEATVVVLGCRVYGERPSIMLTERLEAALAYLQQHPESRCILSGGQGDGESISEAECMYRYLTARGIEPRRLVKEERSTSTRENLLFSQALLEPGEEQVIIITNEFHQYRASRIARQLGLSVSAVNGSTAWWLFPTYYVRELYGIVQEWVFY